MLTHLWGKIKRSPKTIGNILTSYYVKVSKTSLYFRCHFTKCIRVIFLVEYETSCKWEKIYERMANDARFNVLIIVCPRADCDFDTMLLQQERCYQYFNSKGYRVIKAYNTISNEMVSVRELHPSVVFITNPYGWISQSQYHLPALERYYTCYISYNFNNVSSREFYDLPFHRNVWKYYIENEANKKCFTDLLHEDRKSYKVVGYPSFERYCRSNNVYHNKKVIIWAPHHTLCEVFGVLHRDGFLKYQDFMIQMAVKYKNQLDFVFRPHPLLRERLYGWDGWGKQRTDDYYDSWNRLENGRFSLDDDYMQLFADSSAMIHDCGSFTIEYLYSEKPVMFMGDRPDSNKYLSTTNAAFDCYEFAHSQEDIESFIQSVINEEPDVLLEKKREFKKKYLIPENGKTASENIIDDLLESFKIK